MARESSYSSVTSAKRGTFDGVSESPADDVRATLQFFLEIDKLKEVERRNFLASSARRENTAEHSWHLGIATMIMAPFATEPVDLAKAMCMALVHDIVEIDAGDTFAYSNSADELASKEAREQAAADRLFGMLPDSMGQRFRDLWDEYERGDTPEARYVMAVDRMAPMLLNTAEGGTTWREYGITRDRVIARNGPHIEPALPAVWAQALTMLDAATAAGKIATD